MSRFCNEPTKIGHFQNSESIFEVKYLHNLPENDFLHNFPENDFLHDLPENDFLLRIVN